MSIARGTPCDRPGAVFARYRGRHGGPDAVVWTPRSSPATILRGQRLRICVDEPALVHYGIDGWQQAGDVPTQDSGLGLHVADVPTTTLRTGQALDFTFLRTASKRWEGRDYRIDVRDAAAG
jgi:glucoamylase